MTPPWLPMRSLDGPAWRMLRRRMIFEHGKSDPRVGDVEVIAPFPIILRPEVWDEIARAAEALARETLKAEQELLRRPDLHGTLGLPRPVHAALRGGEAPRSMARQIRFDFHWTTEGWRISEANTDVPGGYLEATGLSRLMAEHHAGTRSCGDPMDVLVRAVVEGTARDSVIALVHATAYTDDRQTMAAMRRYFEAVGRRAVLLAPDHVLWRHGAARLDRVWAAGDVGGLIRFFPAEWLANLARQTEWHHFFADSVTPQSNPASALLTQSKRWSLLADRLSTSLECWRTYLPETRDPREVPWKRDAGWVIKPALGRVGEGVGIPGVTPPKEWRRIARACSWFPGHWVAQRRFEPVPMETDDGPVYPCVGVFTIDSRACGAYGRISRTPLIDQHAMEAAVLVAASRRLMGPVGPSADRREAAHAAA